MNHCPDAGGPAGWNYGTAGNLSKGAELWVLDYHPTRGASVAGLLGGSRPPRDYGLNHAGGLVHDRYITVCDTLNQPSVKLNFVFPAEGRMLNGQPEGDSTDGDD